MDSASNGTASDELRARLGALLDGGARRILGLTGPPGAGKTTLAHELQAHVPGAIIVSMDGFHLANSELARLGRSDRKGAADTFDSAGYAALLKRLRSQGSDEVVYAPEFRREIEEPVAGAIAVLPEHRLVITEGNYLLLATGGWAAVRGLIDEIWYVEIDAGLRLERLIARHVRYGRSEESAREWVYRSDEANAAVIESTRSGADAIVRIAANTSSLWGA
jgi:pantothenate kinase